MSVLPKTSVQQPHPLAPLVVLLGTQLCDNIGMSARAMATMGLTQLSLVAPRDGWPQTHAWAAASGADAILDAATLYADLPQALSECQLVYGTGAFVRDMPMPVLSPTAAALKTIKAQAQGVKVAWLFGPERAGLTNEDMARCDALVQIPCNPDFPSLNLSHAVQVLAYAWRVAVDTALPPQPNKSPPATKAELFGLQDHLRDTLEVSGFFNSPDQRARLIRNLRLLIARAAPTQQEVNTLRGVIKALHGDKKRNN